MTAEGPRAASSQLTVVLVHGAFADGSRWSGVIRSLQAAHVHVVALANPLRGLQADATYLAAIVNGIPGRVVLVGHAYGGMVITNIIATVSNVVGLVYIAAFAPEEGESLEEIGARFPAMPIAEALISTEVPLANTASTEFELTIEPEAYPSIYAADLPSEDAELAAAIQRPISASALSARTTVAAWRTIPSWYVVATEDQMIHPDEQRFFAQRAGSVTVEMAASHAIIVSHAAAIANLILTAIRTIG